MTEEENLIIKEIDDNFIAIANSMKDIDQAINAINECVVNLNDRVKELEEHVVKIPTPDKILYKPVGHDNYLNIKENFDYIYSMLRSLKKDELADMKMTAYAKMVVTPMGILVRDFTSDVLVALVMLMVIVRLEILVYQLKQD